MKQFKIIKSKEKALKYKNIDCILHDYIYECMAFSKIKKKHHIGEALFKYILSKYTNLSILPNSFYTTQNINKIKNVDCILHDYVYECESIKCLEKKYTIDRRKIKRILKYFNVEILSPKFFQNIKKRKNRLPKYQLLSLYNDNDHTVKKISEITKKCPSEILQTIHYYDINIKNNKSSYPEQEIKKYIESISDTKITQGGRKLIKPHEIDLYIPSHKLAIEYNGIYWHSEQQGKDRNYHLNKTTSCEKKGIQLLHIFENEWLNPIKQKIWKSVIANKLGIFETRLGARQTEIQEVPNKESNLFLEENHLQGKCGSSVKYGLYYNGNLVALMTFSKSRFNKNVDWELIRFCSKLHHQVYGAASKLLNHFRKNRKGSIISYANRRWSTGELYDKLGFDFCYNSKPNYFYWKIGSPLLESRNKYQKHKLSHILNHFNENNSEYSNMLNNNYDRIWDCGNKVYITKTNDTILSVKQK